MTDTTHTDTDGTDAETPTEGDVWSRRSFVRYLAPISVAVPVVVEGRTLLGLLKQDFGGGQSSFDKPTGVDVGIGGQLRPDTATREKLQNAALTDTANGRTLTLVVDVRNTASQPYRFTLGAVTTDGGKTVKGGAQTDPVAPGKTASLRATYDLPSGATPKAVETTVAVGNDASKKTVKLAPIPGSGD